MRGGGARALLALVVAPQLVLAPQAAEAQLAHRIALHAPIPMASGSFGRAIEGLGDVDGDGRGGFCVWDQGTNRVPIARFASGDAVVTRRFVVR